jgi:hypothetical protein
MRRRSIIIVAVALCSLVACRGDNTPSDASGATLPLPAAPDTLLPVLDETVPPEISTTLPPDALFGGDLCAALVAGDFSGRLTGTNPLSVDSCQYLVTSGGKEFAVVVQARSQGDFVSPGTTDDVVDEIADLGLAARGVDHGDTYTVIVKVENGFYAVTAPTRATAVALADAAVQRALPG